MESFIKPSDAVTVPPPQEVFDSPIAKKDTIETEGVLDSFNSILEIRTYFQSLSQGKDPMNYYYQHLTEVLDQYEKGELAIEQIDDVHNLPATIRRIKNLDSSEIPKEAIDTSEQKEFMLSLFHENTLNGIIDLLHNAPVMILEDGSELEVDELIVQLENMKGMMLTQQNADYIKTMLRAAPEWLTGEDNIQVGFRDKLTSLLIHQV